MLEIHLAITRQTIVFEIVSYLFTSFKALNFYPAACLILLRLFFTQAKRLNMRLLSLVITFITNSNFVSEHPIRKPGIDQNNWN